MITKMSKYSFIVFHKEIDSFLLELQELGMVDITRHHKAVDDHSREALDTLKRYDTVNRSMGFALKEAEEKAAKTGKALPNPILPECTEGELLKFAETLLEKRTSLLASMSETKKLKTEAEPWGEFKNEDIKRIKSMGLVPHFYAIYNKRYKEQWENDYSMEVLNQSGGYFYFVILSKEGEQYSFEFPESKLPEFSANELSAEMARIEEELNINIGQLLGIRESLPVMNRQRDKLAEVTDLYLADVSSTREAENHIVVMEGFAPTEQENVLKEVLDRSGVLYLSEKAKVEDNPPIKLKNNFFSKLFEPIANLYMLPNYGELDLTPFFAPFYMLFFGFCLGDMGYGLLLTILGIVVGLKMPKFKSYGRLIMFLGIGALIMSSLGGSAFGVKIYDVFDLPESVDNFFFSDIKLFWFAIIFGIFQIVFARLLSAFYIIKNQGWQYGMSNLAWAILVSVLSFMYAGSQMERVFIPPTVSKVLLILSVALILLFTKTEGNIFKRIFGGVTSLYDISGYFGDALSYIRLFGLCTSGGILGMVINTIAIQLNGVPYVGWVLTVVMLIFGHILVLALSCLGAFVHPMRLTFVEFYKNSGFVGGGKEYKPLKKTDN